MVGLIVNTSVASVTTHDYPNILEDSAAYRFDRHRADVDLLK